MGGIGGCADFFFDEWLVGVVLPPQRGYAMIKLVIFVVPRKFAACKNEKRWWAERMLI